MQRRDAIAVGAVGVALAASMLPVAGALRPAALGAAAASLLCLIPSVTSRRVFAPLPPLLKLLLVLVVATAVQLIPLPAAVVGLLSPEALARVSASRHALGLDGPGFLPLSLDPSATWVELAKLTGYAALVAASLRLSETRGGRRALRLLVGFAALSMLLIAFGHRLMGETKLLYGFYEPITYSPKLLTPFININHLSGLLAASACVFAGLALEAKSRESRIAWAGCAAAGLAGSLLVPSRGAALGLACGLAAALALLWVRRRGTGGPRMDLRLMLGLAGGGMLLVAILGQGMGAEITRTQLAELADENTKFGAWRTALGVVADHPVTGIGRGAFEPVFPRYHGPSSQRIYSHVENEYLQLFIDHGLLIGAMVLALAAFVAWRAVRRGARSAAAAGTAGAVVVVLVQNAFDFSLALPGTAAPILVLASTLSYGSSKVVEPDGRRVALRLGLLLGASVIVLAAFMASRSLAEDRRDLRTELASAAATEIEVVARPAIQRHPADALLYAETAKALYRTGSPRAFAYLAAALDNYPNHGGSHHLAARMLRAAGRNDQALGEYALAIENGELRAVLGEVTRLYPDSNDVVRVMPLTYRDPLALLKRARSAGRDDAAVLYGTRLLDLGQGGPDVAMLTAEAAMKLEKPEAAIRALAEAPDSTPGRGALLAQALAAQGRVDEATEILGKAAETSGSSKERAELLETLAKIHQEAGKLLEARAVLKQISGLRSFDNHVRARAHRALAHIERELGNPRQAAWEERQARALLER